MLHGPPAERSEDGARQNRALCREAAFHPGNQARVRKRRIPTHRSKPRWPFRSDWVVPEIATRKFRVWSRHREDFKHQIAARLMQPIKDFKSFVDANALERRPPRVEYLDTA